MATQESDSLLTPEVLALLGESTDVREMYDVVDRESLRRFANAIPDQDPRYWDEELAGPRFGGTTTTPVLVSFIANRQPPWAEDNLNDAMMENWFRDGGGHGRATDDSHRSLTPLRSLVDTKTHLHTGDEIELYRYPRIGDKIFSQSSYTDIQEKQSRSGRPMLMVTTETRYWNQDDEVIMVFRTTGMELR
jgi:acyl dehydratase